MTKKKLIENGYKDERNYVLINSNFYNVDVQKKFSKNEHGYDKLLESVIFYE